MNAEDLEEAESQESEKARTTADGTDDHRWRGRPLLPATMKGKPHGCGYGFETIFLNWLNA